MKNIPWAWLLGFVAVIFNPIIPAKLDRATWTYVDVAVGILFLVSLVFVQENSPQKPPSDDTKL